MVCVFFNRVLTTIRLPQGKSRRDVYCEFRHRSIVQLHGLIRSIWSQPELNSLISVWCVCVCVCVCVSVCVCLRVRLEGEGTYECSVTGLVFEVSEQAVVRYSILSWSKFDTFLTDSWKFAGPIFNVDVVDKDASVLKSILFPHSLCLAGEE